MDSPYTISENDVGGKLGFQDLFYDNDGYLEVLGPCYSSDVVKQDNGYNQIAEFVSSTITSVLEDQPYTYQISTSDNDGDPVTISTTEF